MTVRDNLYAVAAATSLLAAFASFIGAPKSEPPQQHISPITGYPVWHQTLEGEIRQVTHTFILLAFTLATVSAYAAYRAVRAPSRSLTGLVTLSTGEERTSTQINTFILYYIYVTWVAILGYLFFDAGKLWSVVGTLHNLSEIVLLIALHSSGRVTSVAFSMWMIVYVVATIVLSVYLPWPYDAIFFRWQGLCSDFALIIMFVRMYITTKRHLKECGGSCRHDEEIAASWKATHCAQQKLLQELQHERECVWHKQQQIVQKHQQLQQEQQESQQLRELRAQREQLEDQLAQLDDQVEQLQYKQGRRQQQFRGSATLMGGVPIQLPDSPVRGSNSTNSTLDAIPSHQERERLLVTAGMLDMEEPVWSVVWHNPRQLLILVAGAVVHVVGNVLTTIFAKSVHSQAVFLVSYGLSFPLYAYYLYIDNNALRQTKIYLPDFSKVKNFTVVCWSIFGSTLVIRLGLFYAQWLKKNADSI
ncbi:hypothetical protein B0O80DRAFT_499410 [Mortierella sp. GBAus27b]|nr:hypothetical protein B0O80DRAFT_499410 [Mortierella sp. GBAus27b]